MRRLTSGEVSSAVTERAKLEARTARSPKRYANHAEPMPRRAVPVAATGSGSGTPPGRTTPAAPRTNRSNPNPMNASRATKPAIRSHVSRRLRRCSSKRLPATLAVGPPAALTEIGDSSAAIPSPRGKVDARQRLVPRVCLEELGRAEAERARHEVGWEDLLPRVVARDQIVVELARESNPVLGGDQLLLQCEDVRVRLEIG